jgi:hypothetical protein
MSIGTFDPGLKEDAGLAPFAAGARESNLFASVSHALAPVLFAVVWLVSCIINVFTNVCGCAILHPCHSLLLPRFA